MDPQNSGPDCILGGDRVLILCCSFLLQHGTVYPDSICFFNILFFHDRSFFGSLTLCSTRSVVLSILCHDVLIYGYWNIFVATLTIMLQHCFCAASSNCVATQFLCRDSISVGSCCNNVSFIVCIPVATRKVCHNRVLSLLNLFSCCSFILMLQQSLLV